ncbi:MAG: metallopeptidase family protein [Bryobacteraceae bacterium]|nr:metallopeptidase family protein [Bryobacteraceae bacterium]
MRSRNFEQLVEQALAELPLGFRRRLRNVVIVVEDEPPRPGLLGLYQGRPLTGRSFFTPVSIPDRITIYQGPHERAARSANELKSMVFETVWHEIGHYFGMNEQQAQRAERRRAARRRLL